jgi:hypothetical protein
MPNETRKLVATVHIRQDNKLIVSLGSNHTMKVIKPGQQYEIYKEYPLEVEVLPLEPAITESRPLTDVEKERNTRRYTPELRNKVEKAMIRRCHKSSKEFAQASGLSDGPFYKILDAAGAPMNRTTFVKLNAYLLGEGG